jgi:hypothetical protein
MKMIDAVKIMMRLLKQFHAEPRSRAERERVYGQVWDEQELLRDFEVLGWIDSAVEVRRNADGAHGSLSFQDCPRYYYCWIQCL